MLQCSLFPQSKILKRPFTSYDENTVTEDPTSLRLGRGKKALKSSPFMDPQGRPLSNESLKMTRESNHLNFDWQRLSTMSPCDFLRMLLKSRGFLSQNIKACEILSKRPSITKKQVEDYDHSILSAVRSSDLEKIKLLKEEGKSMVACNQFGESILHLVCRSGSTAAVAFMLQHCENMNHVDDYGRNFLHDACWRTEPSFEIITAILDRATDLIRSEDVRGHTPLDYIPKDQWGVWCSFLYVQKERYWPKPDRPTQAAASL